MCVTEKRGSRCSFKRTLCGRNSRNEVAKKEGGNESKINFGCVRFLTHFCIRSIRYMTKARLASPRPWFKVLVYVAAKLVRIATALLKYGETFSFEKAGISKAVLKQWELEQAKAA